MPLTRPSMNLGKSKKHDGSGQICIELTFGSMSNVASHRYRHETRSHPAKLRRLWRKSEHAEMGTVEGRLTKDDRWDVVIAEERVYETDLLLLWPDNVYAEEVYLKVRWVNR
jgi:hypothetical protein